MGCLSQDQLAQLAAGLDRGGDLSSHVEQCPACQAQFASLRRLTDQLSAAHARLNREHEGSRSRLIASLPTVERRPLIAKVRHQFPSLLGGLTMRQRIALGGVSVTTAVALLLVWVVDFGRPVSAMDRMAESIRRAKSYTVNVVADLQIVREPGKSPVKAKMTGTWYWLAPGSMRMEFKGGEFTAGQDHTDVFPAGKDGIHIDHKSKEFHRAPTRRGHMTPLMIFEGLSKYSGQADRELGKKQINGKEARGFVIEIEKVDPDVHSGTLEVWIDAESNQPLELEFEITTAMPSGTMRMVDFRWNVDLDRKLFEPTPPEGYTDTTREPPGLDEQIGKIKEALKLFAELSGGHYPRVKMIYGDVTRDQMREMAGFKEHVTMEQRRGKMFKRIQDATWGLATINTILRDNSDAAYHGREVGPKDKDRVLLRWKLDDGQYQVIYGDLRSESVNEESLRTLEGK